MANWRQKNMPETAMERLTNIARSNRVASAVRALREDAMLKPLEQRVEDLEDIVADIPALVNFRLEKLNTGIATVQVGIDEILARLPKQ
jgi:hypothetical protein